MHFRIEMYVCIVLKANLMDKRVRAYALNGRKNFATQCVVGIGIYYPPQRDADNSQEKD